MTTRMKLAALIGVCSMYGVFAACGGGGGGSDGAGNRVEGTFQCSAVPITCPDGTPSRPRDGITVPTGATGSVTATDTGSKECAYVCGQGTVITATHSTTETNTVTATRTETITH